MKTAIHPTYNKGVQVQCICGNQFEINTTTKGPIKIESCPACHPAYNKGIVQTKVIKGRMEKFLEKQNKMSALKDKTPAKKASSTTKKVSTKKKA